MRFLVAAACLMIASTVSAQCVGGRCAIAPPCPPAVHVVAPHVDVAIAHHEPTMCPTPCHRAPCHPHACKPHHVPRRCHWYPGKLLGRLFRCRR